MTSFAYVFPGQGSQHVGMLSLLDKDYPEVRQCFTEVSERLHYDVWKLVQEGPVEKLNQTEYTQVAMLTADVAVYQVIQGYIEQRPKFMAGHSLGEYAALVCSRAMTLADAAELVAHRGRLMQETVPLGSGAMAVIVGLDDEAVRSLCKEMSHLTEKVSAANYNAIGQVVVAGHTEAVMRALAHAEEKGARMAKLIPVSVPCHCELLSKAAEEFAPFLQRALIKTPEFPVISNVDLSIYSSPLHIIQLLQAQLYHPVRWVETMQKMQQEGVTSVIECGPGRVLSGLVKRIDPSLRAMSVFDVESLNAVVAVFKE